MSIRNLLVDKASYLDIKCDTVDCNKIECDGLTIEDNFFKNKYICSILNSVTQSVGSGGFITIAMNTVDFDTSGGLMPDLGNNSIVIQKTGYYMITTRINWGSVSLPGIQACQTFTSINGIIKNNVIVSEGHSVQNTRIFLLNQGDIVKCIGFQNSGSPNTANFIQVHLISN